MTYSGMSFMRRWLQQHQHALGPLADRTVQQLGLADRWVLKTPLDTSCIQVFTPLQCSECVCAHMHEAQSRLLLNCRVVVLMAELCMRLVTGCQCVCWVGATSQKERFSVHQLPSLL